MSGRRLVQRQRLEPETRLRFEVVSVDVEDARPFAIGRRRLVRSARRGGRAELLHRADLVVRFREVGEQLRQQRVDAPLHVAIGAEQFVLAVEVELRVFLEVLEERVEIALEAHLLLHREHLAANARDFREARAGGSRPAGMSMVVRLADAPAIPGLAVGQIASSPRWCAPPVDSCAR